MIHTTALSAFSCTHPEVDKHFESVVFGGAEHFVFVLGLHSVGEVKVNQSCLQPHCTAGGSGGRDLDSLQHKLSYQNYCH